MRLSCAQLEGGGEGIHSTARLLEPESAFLRAEPPISQHEMQTEWTPTTFPASISCDLVLITAVYFQTQLDKDTVFFT